MFLIQNRRQPFWLTGVSFLETDKLPVFPINLMLCAVPRIIVLKFQKNLYTRTKINGQKPFCLQTNDDDRPIT